MPSEPSEARRKRLHQRRLFDQAAELYAASRRSYPPELVDFMVDTASLHPGSAVLEVGCGTGQLTGQLTGYGFELTAIDIGASMISAAQRSSNASVGSFHVVSFEEFEAPESSLDLIVSATAFHWVDPEMRFEKAARLLRPDGWLALFSTGERYDDPFGTAILDMWVARSDDSGAWAKQRKLSDTDIPAADGLFGVAVERAHSQTMRLPVDTVIGVENTRATFLSWAPNVQQGFNDELRRHLRAQADVPLSQETKLTMAQVLRHP
jgi:SAM-dependent methyltransferase